MATKYVVTGDQYRVVSKRAMEILRQLDQKGGSPFDPEIVARELQRISEGQFVELPFADEEVESNYVYPPDFRFRTAEEQLIVWNKHFPNLDVSRAVPLAQGHRPEGAELWGVIPKPSKIGDNYHQALDKMFALIAEQRDFKNWREGELGPERLRLVDKTVQTLQKLERETPGDYLVFPFQFGLRWRGRSVRRAKVCFTSNEWGLGPYEVAAVLFTHPDRISGKNQLYIDCAGCEYYPNADGSFDGCLCFRWSGGQLSFDDSWVDNPSAVYGSVSAFAP